MFLYMGSVMICTVVEDAFFVYKACTVDIGLPVNICTHINEKEYSEYNKQVQVVVSDFNQYANLAGNIVPTFLALYLGVWSDKKGRKLTLLLGLFGALLYWVMMYVNALQEKWSVYMLLYTAIFPSALTGNSLAIFMSAVSYVCDITSPEDRTVRVTLLEFSYLITLPTGVAFGSYLFNQVFQRSYAHMFFISSCLLSLSIIYSCFALKWKTATTICNKPMGCKSTLIDTLKVISIPKRKYHTFYFLLVIFALGLYTFQREEKTMVFLYTQLKFNWDVRMYSSFRMMQSTFLISGLLIGVPLLTNVFKLRDTTIIMIGAMSHSIARVIYATAQQSSIFYTGTIVGALGPIVAPVLRSLTSKLVPTSNRGKAFALLSVADTSVPMLSAPIYTYVYNATINYAPAAVFLVTICSQVAVFISAMTIHCLQKGRAIKQALETDDEFLNDSETVTNGR